MKTENVSRQLKWQRQCRAEGRCKSCGAPSEGFSYCTLCTERKRKTKYGFWKPGGRGRPPVRYLTPEQREEIKGIEATIAASKKRHADIMSASLKNRKECNEN